MCSLKKNKQQQNPTNQTTNHQLWEALSSTETLTSWVQSKPCTHACALPLSKPRNFVFLSIHQDRRREHRISSWQLKTGIKLLQDKVDAEHCPSPRVLACNGSGQCYLHSFFFFPIAFLIEDSCECGALCWTQHRLTEMRSEHRQHWNCFPLGTWAEVPSLRTVKSVNTKQPLSCQAVKELRRECLQCASYSATQIPVLFQAPKQDHS